MRSLLVLLLVARVAHADGEEAASTPGRPVEKGTFGIGIILGEPTGVTAKLYLSDDQAVQIAAGAAFIGGGLQIHGDYVFHPLIIQDRDTFVLPLYLGPGIRFIDYNEGRGVAQHYALGLRAVVGLLFDFKNAPLDVFLEVAAVGEWDFGMKQVQAAFNVGAGVRYYF